MSPARTLVKISHFLPLQIDFREPFMLGLIASHLILTTLILMTRSNCNVHLCLFIVLSE